MWCEAAACHGGPQESELSLLSLQLLDPASVQHLKPETSFHMSLCVWSVASQRDY